MHFYNKTENTIQIFILEIILKVCPSIISQSSEIYHSLWWSYPFKVIHIYQYRFFFSL